MNRLFDLIAAGCVAVVVLLPKASVDARPAVQADKVDAVDASRIAELEEALARDPKQETIAVELAQAYLRIEHPDWALVALSGFEDATASAKLWLLRATAHAERLEAAQAVVATRAGAAACARHGCPAEVGARITLIAGPMQALVDQHIDPKLEPQRAKEAVGKVLHATHAGTPGDEKK